MNKLKTLASYARGNVLDVGYADQPNPYLKDAIGLDIKKSECPKNYLFVMEQDLNKGIAMITQNDFDSIILGDVIEHVENPMRLLRECHDILSSHGRLIISTPNTHYWSEFTASLWLRKDGNYEHINLFSKQEMIRALKSTGFRIIEIKGTFFELYKFHIPSSWSAILSNQIIYVAMKK